MAALGAIWTVVMVTVVTSKPVCLNVGEDSSKSLESSESSSSEETATHFGPSQSAFTETDMQTEALDTPLLPSADSRPFSATLDNSALPDLEDPQTSTDALPLVPKASCQNAPGGDAPQDVCNSEASLDFLDAGIIISSKTPEATSTVQEGPQDATPPFPLQVVTPTTLSFSTDSPLTIPVEATRTGAPLCFTIQLTTPEAAPPRGDSI